MSMYFIVFVWSVKTHIFERFITFWATDSALLKQPQQTHNTVLEAKTSTGVKLFSFHPLNIPPEA